MGIFCENSGRFLLEDISGAADGKGDGDAVLGHGAVQRSQAGVIDIDQFHVHVALIVCHDAGFCDGILGIVALDHHIRDADGVEVGEVGAEEQHVQPVAAGGSFVQSAMLCGFGFV